MLKNSPALLLDLAPAIIRDLDDQIVFWTRGSEHLYGWRVEEAVGKISHQLLQTRFPEPLEKIRAQLFNEGKWEGELVQRARDGSEIIVASQWVLQTDEQDRPACILELNQDTTRLKREVESLRDPKVDVALAQLAAIVESSDDAIIGKTLDGILTSWNAAAERMYGYTAAEVIGRHINFIIPPERLDELSRIFENLRQKKRIDHLETVRVRKDGTRLDVLVSISPINDAQGNIVGAATIASDITERKRAEKEKALLYEAEKRAREEAERANRLKDEFLATVSHELRTPLTAILGWVMLLRSGRLNALEAAQGLNVIERNAKSQKQIIDDLLDVSRIIKGKLRLNVCRFELEPVIEAAIEAIGLAAESKEIEIRKTVHHLSNTLTGDPDRLQQIIWNLLSNAVKFTPKGGRIEIEVSELDSSARIVVSDTGPGISPQFLPYVFERFRQADNSSTRLHGGLGLGLAIVRHLVELHGGSVQAENGPEGRGATFTVNLPLVQRASMQDSSLDEEPPRVPVETPDPHEPDSSLKGLRVLIVDDEPDALKMLCLMLAQWGVEVFEASSAPEARRVLDESQVDILLTDIGMPEEDGYMLLHSLNAAELDKHRHLPVIALTAYATDEDRARALAAGFQAHLAKPVDQQELFETLAGFHAQLGQV